MASGLTATLTLAQVNQQVGTALALIVKGLDDLNDFNNRWLAFNGTAGLAALGASSADSNDVAAAVFEAVKLREVMIGTANVAANGTIAENSTGHNFLGSFRPLLGSGIV